MMLLGQCEGKIGRRLQSHLDRVEARFAEELQSDLDCVNTLTRHVERYRGKMLRPTLVLISAMAGAQAAHHHESTPAAVSGWSNSGLTGASPSSSRDPSNGRGQANGQPPGPTHTNGQSTAHGQTNAQAKSNGKTDGNASDHGHSDSHCQPEAGKAGDVASVGGLGGERDIGPAYEPGPPHHTLGAVVEMVHMATLVHDDILDEAEIRRGGATLNHLSGNEAAVMLGDYLISHAYHLCSSMGRADVSPKIAQTTNTICEGELLQLANRNNWQLDEQTYFEIIRRKTASLCGVCCRLGVELASTPKTGPQPNAVNADANDLSLRAQTPRSSPGLVADSEGLNPAGANDRMDGGHERSAVRLDLAGALETYGQKLGVAFQIVDDLLDLTGEPERAGKTLGRDLEKGKLTLPLIRFLDQAKPAARTQTLEWLRGQSANKPGSTGEVARHQRVRQLQRRLKDTEALAYAQSWAKHLVGEAKATLTAHLPPSPARRVMIEMADAVLKRQG